MLTPEQIAAAGTESAHQKALFAFLAIQPDPRLKLAFAIPNGGHRDKVTACNLRAAGVKGGVPDLFLPVGSRGYYGLWIELKKAIYRNRKNGGCSDEQVLWINNLRGQRYFVSVCYSWEEAKECLLWYVNET
jgi:hypothetical protein